MDRLKQQLQRLSPEQLDRLRLAALYQVSLHKAEWLSGIFLYRSQVRRHKRMGWKPPMHPIKGYTLKGSRHDS